MIGFRKFLLGNKLRKIVFLGAMIYFQKQNITKCIVTMVA